MVKRVLIVVCRVDPNFKENEELWEQIKKEILGDDEDNGEDDEGHGDDEDDEGRPGGDDDEVTGFNNPSAATTALITTNKAGAGGDSLKLSEQELVDMRRKIYLTIMSSVSFEECSHKLLKLNIPEGYEKELCSMLIECCSNERSFLRYYGLMGQRFCMIHQKYQDAFDDCFREQYETIHRLETNKLRNVAKFFGHLLAADALPWTCFEYIRLNEHDTTSSSRIFIKILVQDLAEVMGLATLIERFNDEYMADIFSGLFPRDNPRNTRFAINFFTSIGLGGLTDGLRDHLKELSAMK